MIDFKVGDVIEATGTGCTAVRCGQRAIVTEVVENYPYFKNVETGKHCSGHTTGWSLVETTEELINQGEDMSEVKTVDASKLVAVNRAVDDQVLTEAGITNSEGVITQSGEAFVAQLYLDSNKDSVVAAVKKAQGEDGAVKA